VLVAKWLLRLGFVLVLWHAAASVHRTESSWAAAPVQSTGEALHALVLDGTPAIAASEQPMPGDSMTPGAAAPPARPSPQERRSRGQPSSDHTGPPLYLAQAALLI